MTAGDLIRAELDKGGSELGLAKRIAGQKSDTHPEVQRWRFVIHRAAEGAEPNSKNARRVSEALGQKVETPHKSRDRLAKLEADLEKSFRSVFAGHRKMLAEIQKIQETLDERLPEQPARTARNPR